MWLIQRPKSPTISTSTRKKPLCLLSCCPFLSIPESCIVSIHVQVLHSRRKIWLTAHSSLAAVLRHNRHNLPITAATYPTNIVVSGDCKNHKVSTSLKHTSIIPTKTKAAVTMAPRHTSMVLIRNAHLSLQGYYTSKTSLCLHGIQKIRVVVGSLHSCRHAQIVWTRASGRINVIALTAYS